jgi:hypothetical protein
MNPIDRRALLKRFREATPRSKEDRIRSYSPNANLINESFDAAESAVSAAELAVESSILPFSASHTNEKTKIDGIDEDVISRALAVIDRSRKAFEEGLSRGLESRGLHFAEGHRSIAGGGVSTISLPAPRAAAIPSLSLKNAAQTTASSSLVDTQTASLQDADGDVVSLLASSSYGGKQSSAHYSRDSIFQLGFASAIPGLTLQQQQPKVDKQPAQTVSAQPPPSTTSNTTTIFPIAPPPPPPPSVPPSRFVSESETERIVTSMTEFNVKADTLDVSSDLATAVLNLSMPLDLTSIPNAAANECEETQSSVENTYLRTINDNGNLQDLQSERVISVPSLSSSSSVAQLFGDCKEITFESTAEEIALEDPEVTVERLRRRLAAIDDALMPRMASYLPRSSVYAVSQVETLANVTDEIKAEAPATQPASISPALYVSPPHSPPPRNYQSTPSAAAAALSRINSPTEGRRNLPMVLIYDPAINAYVPADAPSSSSVQYFNHNGGAQQVLCTSSMTTAKISDGDLLPLDPPLLQRQSTVDIQTSSAIATPQRPTSSSSSSSSNILKNNDYKNTSHAQASVLATSNTLKRRESQSIAGGSVRSTKSTESLLTRIRSVRNNTLPAK